MSPTTTKTPPFRLCIAFLLIVQIACWALTLLDLVHPGRPQVLLRTTMDTISLHFSRQSSVLLRYRDGTGVRGLLF
ncbi:hypothetical protein BDW02DRAFT_511474 [Decorospora gaudefroyi]|uniref:Uncharacterized protein n=1 Tax=Decorospora gaudefroyi TaxID=184978 RepID=A0A6A5JW80_9PLEO|nr:hypothetical protein BDW02DRAFT_511474 [Decorospora gaudefroyi]